jgi:alkylation response protein AidB-like acyl-CoA dehydrogenase
MGSFLDYKDEVFFNDSIDSIWPIDQNTFTKDLTDKISSCSSQSEKFGEINEEVLSLLKKYGYFGFAVPREFSGKGCNVLNCCAAQRKLGMLDPGLSIALNMHIFSVGVVKEHWIRKKDLSWALLEAIASQNVLIASAFAEPGLAGNILRSNCTARKIENGYIISGKKSPCSLISKSDLVCFQFECNENLHVALIPSKGEGISCIKTWNTLGMRSSESDTLIFNECFIPGKLVFHTTVLGTDDSDVFKAGMCWFSLMTTATYLGICRKIIEIGANHLNCSISSNMINRGNISPINSQLGHLVASYMTLENSCQGLALTMDLSDQDMSLFLPRCLSLKYCSVESTQEIISGIMEICGGISYGIESEFSRYWRDAQAIMYHPPTRLVTAGILGKWIQGKSYTYDF